MAYQSEKSFDYIVVGAGSSGCVLASRLSEDTGCSVLLLEAGGPDKHPYLRMPLAFLKVMVDPQFDWGYMSEPEPTLDGRRLWIPRGKVLGGSSTTNGMFYMRGHPRDFNSWYDSGCAGWKYEELLPYFKRAETHWRGAGPYHGGDGPINVIANATRKLLHEPLMEAASAAGYPLSDDIDGANPEGFALGQLSIDKRGRRSSTSRAYLYPAMQRANLTVELRALTTRVLVENGRVKGVEYKQNGEQHRALAGREVILCGGTYNSPQLLLLSGIGPAEDLRQHGIEPVVDLSGVGRNMSEHPATMIEFAATKPVTFLRELRADRVAISVMRWALFGSGPFATQINSANGLIRTLPDLERPDVQLMCNPVRMDAEVWFPGFSKQKQHVFSVGIVGLHPYSRGQVSLRSANPEDKPVIQMNLLQDVRDYATLRRGIRAAREIYRTSPQAELTGMELIPGADILDDAELDAFIRNRVELTQHPVGTCSMGIGSDAVVDPQLKVNGIAGLRVADASIMPSVPGGNTNAAAIMIGEKAADLIRGLQLAPETPAGENNL
jgi:choline dehydrogenase